MLIDELSDIVSQSPEVKGLWERLDAGDDAQLGLAQSARCLLVAARFSRVPQPTLVVLAGEDAAVDYARRLAAYVGEGRVLRYPMRSDLPWEEKPRDANAASLRMSALHALVSGRDVVVVASVRAIMRCLPPNGSSFFEPLDFRVGRPVGESSHPLLEGFDSIAGALVSLGYENTEELEGPGSFCVHGGTVDVYSATLGFPVRIDCFGDEVDEIRRIVPSTGQTIASLEQVELYPVREFQPSKRGIARARDRLARPAETNPQLRELLSQLEGGLVSAQSDALLPYLFERTDTLGDFLKSDCLTVLDEPRSLIDDAIHYYDELKVKASGSSISLDGLFCEPAKLDFGTNQRLTYQAIMRAGDKSAPALAVKRTEVAGGQDKLFVRLRTLAAQGYTCVFSLPNLRMRNELKLELVDRGIPIVEHLADQDDSPGLAPGVVTIVDNDIGLGLVVPSAKLALVGTSDLQGAGSVRPTKQVDITQITFPYAPGDYVVHSMHGVARFADLVRRELDGVERDYLLLEYAEDDKLYVPVEQLDRVTRYVGPEGSSPRLTRLNTSDWSRAIQKARKASKKLAFDLIDVYARRASAKGYAYGPDTPWQREMEEAFPFQETPDQLAAIADVKADMQAARPMDRLICGDVGFGKTEVALRAAFKATQDNKQVMVLCPTTILAQQHYSTFKERFEPFGVSVEVLSRFRTPQQQREALEGFANGSVGVLVGTHRLLSRDVNPHDLGLVIIDEEQRFGVGHKEQMKNLRESIDVLTLSATPIPRTMQMSLSGVRDLSLILSPPDDRKPVEVHVGEWDPDVVSAAIRFELERKGQVYYVSNRVRSIEDACARVISAAPEARVGVAHGQMGKDALEAVMEEFSAGLIDVLVATTIIESGIDNPHTNTLIIEDAQRLGLAQMYQLKGRVGRSTRQAYAYFMFPESATLTEEAVSRLVALGEHQELGSGMRVALRDLEIRGAGSMLGAEQSGNMSAVGFDLFAQMLATAVVNAQAGTPDAGDGLPEALSDIVVNVPEHTYLPEDYIPDADERVVAYRRCASAASVEAVDDIERAVASKHPDMPDAAKSFFMKTRVRALAHQMGISQVNVVAGKLNIEPVAKPTGELWLGLRRARARYVDKTGKLQVPLAYFGLGKGAGLLEATYHFLQEL